MPPTNVSVRTTVSLLSLTALVVSVTSTPAAAYCRTMSCELGEDPLDPRCARDEQGCVIDGAPIRWPDACLTYAVQPDGASNWGLNPEGALALVDEAFALWEGAPCPGGGTPGFRASFQGFASCHHQEALCGGREANVNVVMFYDEGWPGTGEQLGLTTPVGSSSDGVLVDGDVQLNATNVLDPDDDALYQLYVVSHELGHFLGLGHTGDGSALMSRAYRSVMSREELLAPDDIAAICAAYPPNAALICQPPPGLAYDMCQLPRPGTEPHCHMAAGHPSASRGGCSIGTLPAKGSEAAGALLVLFATLGFARRLRLSLPRALVTTGARKKWS